MSVSDPLLKRLKDLVKLLRTDPNPIEDDHACLQAFCETLELIFRKGIKQSTSIFGMMRKDYWHWIETVAESNNNTDRVNPVLSMLVHLVKSSKKAITVQGKGRLFIRLALQRKCLKVPVERLLNNERLREIWYDPVISILGDEILSEILMSVLHEVSEIKFQSNTMNASFLDETWTIPVYRILELVPCKDLGLQIQYIDGRAVVASASEDSVAAEDNQIEPGDVLEEIFGESLKGVRKGQIPTLLKRNQGAPVGLAVVKCKMPDGAVFRPIVELLKKVGKDIYSLQKVLDDEDRRQQEGRIPPHAQLAEDEFDEVPVHNSEDKAKYRVKFIGKVTVGTDGGVSMIEGAINSVLKMEKDGENQESQDVNFELGETDVLVTSINTNELIYKHSYTEISSCGRRIDSVEYFAYMAGETTCTMAKQFVAYVFKAVCDEESKTILCSIAQGFERTHWYV